MTERARKLDASRLKVLSGGSPTPAPSYRLLTQVSAALSTSLNLDRALKEILERLNALVAFDAATVFLLDDSRSELHVKAALGVPVALKEVKSFKVGEGVVGWVVRQGASALIKDSSKDARYKVTGPERRPRTVLAAPLRAQENLLGALVLVRAATEPFGPEHQRLVEAIASQAAVAIDHARLFETERASRRRAEALLAMAQAGSEATATPELLQRAVKQVAFAMRATAAAVIALDEAGETIETAFDAAEGSFGFDALRSRSVDALPLLDAVRRASKPLVVQRAVRPALLEDAYWSKSEATVLAAIPVRWQGRLTAALLLGFSDPDRLTAPELELLDEIGRQIALSMERLRLQRQVQEQQNEIAVSAERNRIARDMHDGLVQYVYALGLQLEHARDLLESDAAAVPQVLTGAIQKTNHVLSEMRTFLYELRPIIMKEKELGQWVVDLCQKFEQATGIKVQAELGAAAGQELSPEISIALFRIIQEALSNIYKHAQASAARVRLDFTPGQVELVIEDNGHGFDVKARQAPGIEHGHGLGNIEERVRELDGTVMLESTPEKGTRLRALFPNDRSTS